MKTCSSKTLILDHGVFFPLCRLFDITWVASHYGYQERTYQVIGIFQIAVYVAPKDSLSFRYAQAFLLVPILYFNSLIYSFTPWKHQKIFLFCGVFRWYKVVALVRNGFMWFEFNLNLIKPIMLWFMVAYLGPDNFYLAFQCA